MKKIFLLAAVIFQGVITTAQNSDNNSNLYPNTADNLLNNNNKLVVGGYGEVHYNQPLDGDVRSNGKMDVHRMVMLFGYNFNERVQFITELEFEHVQEVYVEQAFMQYKLNNYLNFRGGLLLVPMGVTNEYHEPTAFNGVERPVIDNMISPTTWREIGFGVTGNVLPAFVKYQAYIMNGFNGYNGNPKLNGKNGLRSGRQKGAESYISSPNFTGKIEYYGVRGLNIGVSGYFGKTQSTLYNGMDKNDKAALATADSSVVGVTMLGVDARYNLNGWQFRGQFYHTGLGNSDQYNVFTAAETGTLNDLGSSMIGYYVEAAYNVLRSSGSEKQLLPFVRYEFLNTHNSVGNNITKNLKYEKSVVTTGLTFALTKGAVVKADIQFIKDGSAGKYSKTFNTGIGVMF